MQFACKVIKYLVSRTRITCFKIYKESTFSARSFDLWVENIPWRRKWQPTPVLVHRKSHEQRSLAGYSP